MQRPANPGIDPVVFWIAAVLSAAFVAWGILGTESLAAVFDAVLWSFLVPKFGLVFIPSSSGRFGARNPHTISRNVPERRASADPAPRAAGTADRAPGTARPDPLDSPTDLCY
jgi:hypothetical protein